MLVASAAFPLFWSISKAMTRIDVNGGFLKSICSSPLKLTLSTCRCSRFPLGFQTLFNMQTEEKKEGEAVPALEEENTEEQETVETKVLHVGLHLIGSDRSAPYLMVSVCEVCVSV